MTIPNITPLPTPVPSRADPTNFATRADAFLGALPTFGTELNNFATEANTLATDVQDNKDSTDQTLLDMQALELTMSSLYNNSVATSNFKGLWSSLTGALNKPASVYHNNNYWILLNNLTDVTASTPSDANADWLKSSIDALGTTYDPSNTALGATNVQSAIDNLYKYANYLSQTNIVINPDFRISQEFGSTVVNVPSGNTKYVVDQWQVSCTGANINVNQDISPSGGLFIQAPTTGNTSTILRQKIEQKQAILLSDTAGYLHMKVSSLTARTITWTINSPNSVDDWTGGSLVRATGTFTINSLQVKEVKIPLTNMGSFSSGCEIVLSFGGLTSVNTWVSVAYVQLRSSSLDLPFIPRPYQQELAMCQRYWETGRIGFNGAYQLGGSGYTPYANFVVTKRTTPTMTLLNLTTTNLTGFGTIALSANSFRYGGQATSTGVIIASADYVANARL